MPSKDHSPQNEVQESPVSVESLERQEEMLWISHEPALQEAFPPCIKAVLNRPAEGKGKHRTAAILASFLGQVGYQRDEAGRIWHEATEAEERIFEEWFCRMHCPKCRALQRKGSGYPELGIADLGLCRPDDLCPNFEGPVEYACRILSEKDRERGELISIKTRYRLRIFDWSSGKETAIELSEKEGEALVLLLREKAAGRDKILVYKRVLVKGRLKPCFSLRDQEEPRRQMLSDLI
ncbi:MAG TPA: hypothetical protein PLK98_04135 [Methanothrix sp.]|nr:hypothetical protein [Methanothrix sp.]